MIGRLAMLAIDARYAVPRGSPAIQAMGARWIAANALAAWGVPVVFDGAAPGGPRIFELHAPCFTAAMAAIASVPVLVDASSLPRGWGLALRALGLPSLDRTAAVAIAEGASVLTSNGSGSCGLSVDLRSDGYRVRIGPADRMLVA
jgi:hypothetical protein